jgi:hypothetical protein
MKYKILAILLLLSAGVAYAQPFASASNVAGRHGQGPMVIPPPFIKPIFLGHGFALRGSTEEGLEYHTLHVSIVKVRIFPPKNIRSMLAQNKTPEEIAREFQKKKITVVRGHVRFAGTPYILNITSHDNDSLEGDLLSLPVVRNATSEEGASQREIVGHIYLRMQDYEGERVSTGTITINGEDYDILLTSPPARKFGPIKPGQGPPK